jgi:hypothetical protein
MVVSQLNVVYDKDPCPRHWWLVVQWEGESILVAGRRKKEDGEFDLTH